MKPPDKIRDEFVRQWLSKAEEDLLAAKSLASYGDTLLSTVCFHSQQAAEKYLKALLTQHQIEFPKTHDIAEILDLVSHADRVLSETLRDVVVLTTYGVDIRYPGDFPSVTASDAREALEMAEAVRQAVLGRL